MYVVIGIAAVVIALISAVFFKEIAQMKGHEEKRYFWMSFLCGPVGWAMVIALPDRGAVKSPVKPSADAELPEL